MNSFCDYKKKILEHFYNICTQSGEAIYMQLGASERKELTESSLNDIDAKDISGVSLHSANLTVAFCKENGHFYGLITKKIPIRKGAYFPLILHLDSTFSITCYPSSDFSNEKHKELVSKFNDIAGDVESIIRRISNMTSSDLG